MKKITAVICVDDKMGIMFNGRRQSRDSLLRKWIIDRLGGRKLFMDSYTYGQFSDTPPELLHVTEEDGYVQLMSDGDVCFTEKNQQLLPSDCDYLICRWNRRYPSDEKLQADASRYIISTEAEIEGSSHEKITIEHWVFNGD